MSVVSLEQTILVLQCKKEHSFNASSKDGSNVSSNDDSEEGSNVRSNDDSNDTSNVGLNDSSNNASIPDASYVHEVILSFEILQQQWVQ